MTDDDIKTLVRGSVTAAGIAFGIAARVLAENPPTTKRSVKKATEELERIADRCAKRGDRLLADYLGGMATGLFTKGTPPHGLDVEE